MGILALPSKEQFQPIVEHVLAFSRAQAAFTAGTRRNSPEGWTSMTFEWGKRNASGQQMISLEQSLKEQFPEDCIAAGGPLRLLQMAAEVTQAFRVQERPTTWTPKRGRNAGLVQSGRVHDVFFAGAQARQVYNPFAPEGKSPLGPNPTPGHNPAQGNDVAGDAEQR